MAQLSIRITKNSISFARQDNDWHAYPIQAVMSIEANLRQAFRETDVLSEGAESVTVMVDTPVVMIPLDDFSAEEAEQQYRFLHPDLSKSCIVEFSVLPQQQTVALFTVTKDLKTVLVDHFEHITLLPLMARLWEQFAQHSQTGHNRKLYCYFHDKKMELCSFRRNHFVFQNTFEAADWHDALFFIMGVWQQLDYRSASDDLIILGDIPSKDTFITEAKRYIKRITALRQLTANS